MFEKLLAVMPYNPSLVHQMAFYSRRMHDEAVIRRTGLIFIVLAFFIQFFAVLSPPQPTIAAQSNDLVTGGISSAADAARVCRNDTRDYKKILNWYGISCKDVADGERTTIDSDNRNYFSMGHNPQGAHNNLTKEPTHEEGRNITGAGKLYWRTLRSWDSFPNGRKYDAIRVKNSEGKAFWILTGCGNLTTVGIPSRASKPAIEFGPVTSTIPIPKPTPLPTPTPAPKPTPKPVPIPVTPTPKCVYNQSLPANSPLCFQPCQYNSSVPVNSPLCYQKCRYNASLPATSPLCVPPCEYNGSIPSTSPACKPCDQSQSPTDSAACIHISKVASNVTAGVLDANNTTAKASDVIAYTLYAKNGGQATVKGFQFQENLTDVLDYADITDLHGGTLNDASGVKTVSWPVVDIKPNETASVVVTVKVKAEIPQTPGSATDPMHFDLTMTNVYGNTVNIKLPGSPEKTIETVAATLPNTGPGTSLMIAAAVVIIASYFYNRARLLSTESAIAIKEMASA